MLVKFMDNTANSDFVVVLAGYRNLMTKMLNANVNLMSRMGNWIDFPDYDDAELLQVPCRVRVRGRVRVRVAPAGAVSLMCISFSYA